MCVCALGSALAGFEVAHLSLLATHRAGAVLGTDRLLIVYPVCFQAIAHNQSRSLTCRYYMNGSTMHVLLPYAVHGVLYYGFSSVSHRFVRTVFAFLFFPSMVVRFVSDGCLVLSACSNTESMADVWASGEPIVGKDRFITRVEEAEADANAGAAVPMSGGRKPRERKEWAAHQVETSKGDYSPTSVFWGLMALGLNNQALHHVFPGARDAAPPRFPVRLAKISKITVHGATHSDARN